MRKSLYIVSCSVYTLNWDLCLYWIYGSFIVCLFDLIFKFIIILMNLVSEEFFVKPKVVETRIWLSLKISTLWMLVCGKVFFILSTLTKRKLITLWNWIKLSWNLMFNSGDTLVSIVATCFCKRNIILLVWSDFLRF